MNLQKQKSISQYSVIPRIVRSGEVSSVSVYPCGAGKRFRDGVDYTVRLIPMEIFYGEGCGGGIQTDAVTVKPHNGVLTFTYTFYEEQEWVLSVTDEESEKAGKQAIRLHLYSLFDDLYERDPYRGDLHAHSIGSDGKEDPAIVAANYRREGFDFFALTDHHKWAPSDEMLKAYRDVPLEMAMFHGEEVHLYSTIHIVNFGSRYSVNELFFNHRDEISAELKAQAETLKTPKGVDALEYAYRRWIVEQIRKARGMAIIPHPYWIHHPGIYNMSSKVLDYVFEQGDFDAFELVGGQTVHENNLQNAFYQDQREKGRRIPIVGSSDSHGTDPAVYFTMAKTVLFAKDLEYDSVCEAIKGFYSVAVEEAFGEEYRVYGSYRMVKYARFLLDHYFPEHDALCTEEGLLMREYTMGSPDAAEALKQRFGRVSAYRNYVLRGEKKKS